MKKWIKKWIKDYMIRPIIYQSVTKVSIGLAVALVWDKFINTNQYFSMVEYAFLPIGAFLLGAAWFRYLRMDGVGGPVFSGVSEKTGENRKKKKVTRDIVDFADEKIISFDELEPEEQMVARLASNVLSGLVFLIPAILAAVFS